MAKITNATGPLWLPGIKVGEKVEGPHFVGPDSTIEVSDGYAEGLAKHAAYEGRIKSGAVQIVAETKPEPKKSGGEGKKSDDKKSDDKKSDEKKSS